MVVSVNQPIRSSFAEKDQGVLTDTLMMRQLCALVAKGDSILGCSVSRSMDPFPLLSTGEPSGCCVQFWIPQDEKDVDVLE